MRRTTGGEPQEENHRRRTTGGGPQEEVLSAGTSSAGTSSVPVLLVPVLYQFCCHWYVLKGRLAQPPFSRLEWILRFCLVLMKF
ncbi:hypothetical protein FQA47_013233 [Oryzias melastigma]|uniref:Uncharacterized protein n=1 Tax=Oryzias melastigma TaxID=30732 RepID=A0A834FHE7_ORYME|nr:hypothetical protein FQA47_013233 [Oryzias melastigma]